MRNITYTDALNIARKKGLEYEIARAINEQGLSPWEALYEWDLVSYEAYDINDYSSGAAQYNEAEFVNVYN